MKIIAVRILGLLNYRNFFNIYFHTLIIPGHVIYTSIHVKNTLNKKMENFSLVRLDFLKEKINYTAAGHIFLRVL